MKKTNTICEIQFLVLFFIFITNNLYAYSLRQYSSRNGLSNSAILSMCQDRSGFLWFGSCDGLNKFDGINFQVYRFTQNQNSLSGNIIESVLETENDILWVQTNYGLDRFDSRQGTIRTFKEFKGNNRLIQSPDHEIYVVKEDNYIYYYDAAGDLFHRVFVENLKTDKILEMAIDSENMLWIFLTCGNYYSYKIVRDKDSLSLKRKDHFSHNERITNCFFENDKFYFVDETHELYEYDAISKNKYCIQDITREIDKFGDISSIIRHRDDFFIGFRNSGLIRLQNASEQKQRFIVHEISIKSGIFCLMKDRFQDIIWVGTDGQGVFMYYMDQYSINSTLFSEMKVPLNNSIRAMYIDRENTLWIGTKGDGIVRIQNYDISRNEGTATEQLLSSTTPLKDNSVYAFAPSKKNILWIGSENGINYYSYKERKIKNVPIATGDRSIRYVHSICEFNDTTLWIATVGEGIVKAKLANSAVPEITGIERFIFDGGKGSSNYFFTSYRENDSIIWFGNRGYGAYKINNNTHEIETLAFDDDGTNQVLNDVFSIIKTNKGYWFATSYGLAHLQNGKKQVFNETNGFPSHTIHGILDDLSGNLWLSTNQGIIKFNTEENTFQTFTQQNELAVTEFSDGAYFKYEPAGILFFGGFNGYVTIAENEFSQREYEPSIQFSRLSIFGKECNLFDFMENNKSRQVLRLDYNQNFISLGFSAIDYLNGNDYIYLYNISELSDTWIENGFSNQISFTNMSPGNYTLHVKYRNNITGKESDVQSLVIRIVPPWYRTNLAYFLYILFIVLTLLAIGHFILKWYRLKRDSIFERLDKQQREEIYESKLRFFTNITHELCTPLTLISGPCEKIVKYPKADSYIHKYASLIQYNAEKLNGLIQELIEFRRLETGNKTIDIKTISVSELTRKTAESFIELAETKGFDYQIHVQEDVTWNSDIGCLNKIINNLISNAFKYTPEKGKIITELTVKDGKLYITVSNTGKGIKEEDIPKIFDRYTILDTFEDLSKKGAPSRNGLGLAICSNMVKLLNGEITVTSVMNELTVFTVGLPGLEIQTEETTEVIIEETNSFNPEIIPVELETTLPVYDKSKPTVMIIDDDPSMLWFITEVFVEKYNIIPVGDSREVMEQLEKMLPDLIISDVMMPGIDGILLTKLIKSDKLLSHIPVVLLSAKSDVEEQVKGIDSGAEVYLTKPFNVEYLEKIASRLIKREEDLKEYYGSIFSTFELTEGKIMHKEDKEFFEKILSKIDENLTNPDLSVDVLSTLLGLNTRQLYRKLKNFTDKTPNDIIREYRLNTAEKLLTTTNLSVEEVIYKAGFSNRGNFFKLFSQKYGTTPRNYRDQRKKELKDTLSV